MLPVYVYGAGEMPLPEEIRQCGLKTGESVEGNREGSWLRDAMGSLAKLGAQKVRGPRKAEMVHLGEGLMPLSRRTVERIQAGEFVEFAKFPAGRRIKGRAGRTGTGRPGGDPPGTREEEKLEAGSGCLLVGQLLHPL